MKKKMLKVLVVGQIPPPYNGQAMMIQRLVKAKLEDVDILHVKMAFSDSLKSIGKFDMSKVFHLFEVIYKVFVARFKQGATVLYYPPAGPNRNPILRDLVLLFFIRFLFKQVIFHFRAAGISEFLDKQSILFQKAAKLVYGEPDVAIQLSALNPSDGKYFNAKNVCIIPNGLEDMAQSSLPLIRDREGKLNILFVGLLREDKGVLILVEAAKLLKAQGYYFQVNFIGEFESSDFESDVLDKIKRYELEDFIHFPGLQIGPNKWKYFIESHIFCFPSFYSSESFGNVLLEAMMFELPVVSTRWRGIPDIVADKETGLLVPIMNPLALADALSWLMLNPELSMNMGKNGRERFLSHFTLEKHLSAMENSIKSINNEKYDGTFETGEQYLDLDIEPIGTAIATATSILPSEKGRQVSRG